jgi:hypothetical protein
VRVLKIGRLRVWTSVNSLVLYSVGKMGGAYLSPPGAAGGT